MSATGVSEPKDRGLLKSGDGEGMFTDMETRITKPEASAEDTRSSLDSILRQLARMDTKLDSKPDQGWIINMVCVVLGVVIASIAATESVLALMK